MRYVKKLPDGDILKKEYALTPAEQERRQGVIAEIKAILAGKDYRKLICIGPCSADDRDAVLEYMLRLARLKEKLQERFVLIPRIYTAKPRTTGQGYKGLLHCPEAVGEENIFAGIYAMRQLHLDIIRETGLFSCDELLYPEATYYVDDLLCYATIGARSVENQQHRLVASGYDIPVGMKNPMSGDFSVLLNAIVAAQSEQALLYHGWECHTKGNSFAHAILRGFVDEEGRAHPNYHFEDLLKFCNMYLEKDLQNMGVIVDCNHSNSNKNYGSQSRIAKEVLGFCADEWMNGFIKGIMIESYLEDGAQEPGGGVYGKSITDPCLGWERTERLLLELAEGR